MNLMKFILYNVTIICITPDSHLVDVGYLGAILAEYFLPFLALLIYAQQMFKALTLKKILLYFHKIYLLVSYDSQNKQRLVP
jgi:hypothetical protein